MPEEDNDRLEQFFRKAASKPDVSFDENDWKKLEARLDAEDGITAGAKKSGNKAVTAAAVAVILLFCAGIWVNSRYGFIPFNQTINHAGQPDKSVNGPVTASPDLPENKSGKKSQDLTADGKVKKNDRPEEKKLDKTSDHDAGDTAPFTETAGKSYASAGISNIPGVVDLDDKQILRDLIEISPALAVKYKQKAIVELPGAEEAETGEAESMVKEEHASDQKDHVATPRLSLLLSFAPDFSSTSISRYAAPGKAFGAMIHYHISTRWSFSAGAIKNNKQYTGAGEDYKPPKGYWKYYTNGIIPNSIDGSCSILEFPVMVQYGIIQKGKNRLLAGAGASSYLMLDESYRYYFDEPNPGAKEGWQSRNSSRFLFNMINFTLGYEHQVLPGFMIGLEPYVKIPISEIGWTNLKLYSTGASVTMRYIILQKKTPFVPSRSRGPD